MFVDKQLLTLRRYETLRLRLKISKKYRIFEPSIDTAETCVLFCDRFTYNFRFWWAYETAESLLKSPWSGSAIILLVYPMQHLYSCDIFRNSFTGMHDAAQPSCASRLNPTGSRNWVNSLRHGGNIYIPSALTFSTGVTTIYLQSVFTATSPASTPSLIRNTRAYVTDIRQ